MDVASKSCVRKDNVFIAIGRCLFEDEVNIHSFYEHTDVLCLNCMNMCRKY